MEKSLVSFAKELGEDPFLRKLYRSDPIKALASYGIVGFTPRELIAEETTNAFRNLPDSNLDDMKAYMEIVKYVTKHL